MGDVTFDKSFVDEACKNALHTDDSGRLVRLAAGLHLLQRPVIALCQLAQLDDVCLLALHVLMQKVLVNYIFQFFHYKVDSSIEKFLFVGHHRLFKKCEVAVFSGLCDVNILIQFIIMYAFIICMTPNQNIQWDEVPHDPSLEVSCFFFAVIHTVTQTLE